MAIAAAGLAVIGVSSGVPALASARPVRSAASTPAVNMNRHVHINCADASASCTEVLEPDRVFGHYVGHDEPSALFYSHKPGSGNHMSYNVTLPAEPPASDPNSVNKSYTVELSETDWFGMAMCDTQSYPEQVKTCKPDSDSNILDPTISPRHTGTAFMEMQFYPPGWVPWPAWSRAPSAGSCDPTRWCAALNIDSLSTDPVAGKANNRTCLKEAGEEYVNFAFITRNGRSTGPANPIDSTLRTFTPSAQDLLMNQGDHLKVAFGDTPNGLKVVINDLSSGQSGSMTASKANGFAQIKFDPAGSSCTAIPYDFHPMYSTSSTKTTVPWAAQTYNVAFDSEIGHFQFCTGPKPIPATPFGRLPDGKPTVCPKGDTEGRGANKQPADGDDLFCFPASQAPLFKVAGCITGSIDFDGAPYQKLWPDGNTAAHPTPFQFSSPETGPGYDEQYSRAAFEADLPLLERPCNAFTGVGCTLIPLTAAGQPATFYPFFSTTAKGGRGCVWQFGNDTPGEISDFGQNAQYGSLIPIPLTDPGGGTENFFGDFRNIFANPCPQS